MTATQVPAHIQQKFEAKARVMCANAIGETKTMRLDRKTTQTGVIVEASLHEIWNTGRAWEATFKIVMECGASKTRREFICRTLPQ